MSRIHHHNFVLRPAAPEASEHHVKLHAESTGNKPNIFEVADGVAGTPNEQGTSTMSEARNTYAECVTSRTPWFLTLLNSRSPRAVSVARPQQISEEFRADGCSLGLNILPTEGKTSTETYPRFVSRSSSSALSASPPFEMSVAMKKKRRAESVSSCSTHDSTGLEGRKGASSPEIEDSTGLEESKGLYYPEILAWMAWC